MKKTGCFERSVKVDYRQYGRSCAISGADEVDLTGSVNTAKQGSFWKLYFVADNIIHDSKA